ncbi:hypothetical protein E4U56_002819 [Claviceps arundinis]|uniref:Mitochondrial outer membrane protein OM14 C-terminal domain-containing protein n=1 Tax=Claviceps arundinis TaxID=1623583 RepID=A0A9P7MQF3_9HYPO|nr:hypothetical protein E4U56_002819 [Claviceps arundinis]
MNLAKTILPPPFPFSIHTFFSRHSNNQNEALLRRKQNESPTIGSFLTQTSSSFSSVSRPGLQPASSVKAATTHTPQEHLNADPPARCSVIRRRSRQWSQADPRGDTNTTSPTPQAAAPQPAEIVNTESVATASPLDVDIRSVHTVPSDFSEISEQPIQTEPQANRLDFKTEADVEAEAEAAKTTKAKDKAKDKVQNVKKQTETKARETDSWLVQQFSGLSDGSASALAVTNLVAIIGVSSYLGYKAWGLYERGNLSWKTAGVGVGILAGVGTAEAVLGRYLYKGKKGGS